MRQFNKKLAATATVAALMAGITAVWAQSSTDNDPNATPATAADATSGPRILNFKDQGISPETDPAAHLLLIKDTPPAAAPVVSHMDNTPAPEAAPAPAYTAPPATDSTMMSAPADTAPTPVPADTTPMPAPRADRN